MADCFDDENPPTADASDEEYVALAERLCSLAIFKGDHFEASGTSDPSFFVLHGTLLRYYHYKQIISPLNGTWLSGADACTPRFGTCYSSFGVELDPEICCQGHYEDSQAFTTVDLNETEGWTNAEIIQFMDPLSEDDSYIFHHLRCRQTVKCIPQIKENTLTMKRMHTDCRWEHCIDAWIPI
eukprot:55280_1